MAPHHKNAVSAMEIDRLATQLAKDPRSKAFLPLAEEYCKVGMWEEAAAVLEDGLKYYPGFITAMVALGRAYDQLSQPTKARAVLEGAVKLSPDNLRAHRTLIKIYTSQGLKEEALKSCRVILAINPRDEEALSVQASLGAPHKLEPETPNTSPFVQANAHAPALSSASRPLSQTVATMLEKPEAAVERSASCVEEPVATAERPDSVSQASAHAEIIAQLESWLRSIQRQRRDRARSADAAS